MVRRSLLGLSLVVALAAGCGGGGNPTKERQEFLARANTICSQFTAKQNEVRFPIANPIARDTSPTDRARWGLSLKQVIDYGRQEVKVLRELEPPENLRERFDELVDTKEAAFNDLAKGADAAKRNKRTEIAKPVNAGRAKLTRATTLAKNLGAAKCV
jgi:hypothetical protein